MPAETLAASTSGNGRPRGLRARLAILMIVAAALGCDQGGERTGAAATSADDEILLEGRLRRVAKNADGIVQIRRRDGDYQLVLRGVQIQATPLVRVYILGLDEARSTAAVDGTDSKYDMGPLKFDTPEQVISIPKPLDELRSVVLWNPAFGINLASASLEPPPK